MRFLKPNDQQVEKFSDLLIDLGKLLVASVILGFFLPGLAGEVPPDIFIGGVFIAILSFSGGFKLIKEKAYD